jgi:hypothetical protein
MRIHKKFKKFVLDFSACKALFPLTVVALSIAVMIGADCCAVLPV